MCKLKKNKTIIQVTFQILIIKKMCNRTTPDVDVEFREDIMLET